MAKTWAPGAQGERDEDLDDLMIFEIFETIKS